MRNAKAAPAGWIPFMKSLARDAGLKVVIGGSPATDGKTMWLPALPAELTPDDLVLFKGDGYHEVGHIQRSNIPFFQAFGKEHGSFAGFLLNALDDVFMEGRQAAWKKTAGRYLLDSTMVLIKRDRFRDGSAGLGEAVACYCLAYLTTKRWPTVGVATSRVEVNLRKHLAQHADKVIPELRNLLDAEFPSVNSTEDGGALALKIIKLLKSLAEQDQSQPSPSPESGESKGDDGEGSSESKPTPSDDTDDSGEGQSQGDDDNAESDGEGQGKGEADDSESDPKGEVEGDSNAGDTDPKQDGTGQGNGVVDESESDPKGDGENEDAAGDTGTQQDGESQGKGQGNADDTTSQPKGEGEDEGETENAGANSGKGDKTGDDQGDDNHEGESQNGSEPSGESDKSLTQMVDDMLNEKLGDQEVFDKGAEIKELAQGIASGANEAYKGQPLISGLVFDFSPGAGKAEGFVDGMPVVVADREMATAIEAVSGRKANVMGNRLRALLSNREETDEYSSRNGRLCERNLHRFALNDSRVFAKAEERIEDTAAVSITADLSASTGCGSSGTTVAEQIRIALTIIEKVLHQIGTPREILGFAPNSGQMNCMVKSFQDDHRVALDRIAGLHKLVGGDCTPIGAAVMQAGARLMTHEAQRKLLLVLTDGDPDDKHHALEMTNTVLRSGVEVIYLVIGAESACNWLKEANIKFAYAQNAEGILPAMVDKMAEFLK
uniref:VWFA domain-containing protein n=1 Tax=Pseudomonas fluorescens (strain SBW25) TaxID=216595 RepID=A0A0G4E441_PSEFS|nr:hypothetical protein [Pseudomonas fluorescens]CEK42016.1 hypothetical protein PQBR57_0063 [Pseudomonas fluorescens SBW25]